MISINNSDWLTPITYCYFCIIYIWAYNSGMQIEDLSPFNPALSKKKQTKQTKHTTSLS